MPGFFCPAQKNCENCETSAVGRYESFFYCPDGASSGGAKKAKAVLSEHNPPHHQHGRADQRREEDLGQEVLALFHAVLERAGDLVRTRTTKLCGKEEVSV